MSLWMDSIRRANSSALRKEDEVIIKESTSTQTVFYGCVDTLSDLKYINTTFVGEIVYVKDTQDLYVYDSNHTWQLIQQNNI